MEGCASLHDRGRVIMYISSVFIRPPPSNVQEKGKKVALSGDTATFFYLHKYLFISLLHY